MVKSDIQTTFNAYIEGATALHASWNKLQNAEDQLGCVDGQIIGTGRPDYTQSSTEYNLFVGDKNFLLIDIPGIEGDEGKYREAIKNSLEKAHVIFYVNGSGKKAEKDTLEKIKKYMRDRTSVYAIFNVHCKAKQERIEGFDNTYQETLSDAYKKQSEIVHQTQGELISFLGEKFRGSITLNGLLSFCSTAMDCNGNTTIIQDTEDKRLRAEQGKFLKEYSNNVELMQMDSHICEVQDVIAQKIEHFDEDIFEENLEKLRNRLINMISEVSSLRDVEKKKIKNFLRDYDEFEQKCEIARHDFVQTIGRIDRSIVAGAFSSVQDKLFEMIDECKGKIKSSDVEEVFKQYEQQIIHDIQTTVDEKVSVAINEYQEAILDAENRLCKNLQRDQIIFQNDIEDENVDLDFSFIKSLKFSFKDFAKGAFKVGGYALTGGTIGSAFCPGLGTVIGAVAGAVVGIVERIWSWFASKEKRINKAKKELKESLDAQIDEIAENLKQSIKEQELEKQIDVKHEQIVQNIESQRKALNDIERILNVVVMDLENRYRRIQKDCWED